MRVTRASISPLKSLAEPGQQAWCDNLGREPVASSELARLIAEDDIAPYRESHAVLQSDLQRRLAPTPELDLQALLA